MVSTTFPQGFLGVWPLYISMLIKELNLTQEPLNVSLLVILQQKGVISVSKRFFVTMDVSFNEKQPFFSSPYLQGEPFAEDKEFFPSLPTLPILENSTKTVQIKGSDFSIAVTPENTKKKAPENASNTAPVMPDFSIAVTSGNTQAIALKNASETL